MSPSSEAERSSSRKRPARIEVINDSNAFVVNFYQQLQQNFKALQSMVISSLYSRVLHKHACHIYELPQVYSSLQQAWGFWMLSAASYNGVLASGFGYLDLAKRNV